MLLAYHPTARAKALFVGAVAIEGLLVVPGMVGLGMIAAGLYLATFLALRSRADQRAV